MSIVFDSSAVLAALWNEPGSEIALQYLEDGLISAVNHAEVLTKIADRGVQIESAKSLLAKLAINVVAFDKSQAEAVGELRASTKQLGLSIGDCACLALALSNNCDVLTADKIWTKLNVGLKVQLIR